MSLDVWQWITAIALGIFILQNDSGWKEKQEMEQDLLEVLEMNGALCLEPFQMMRFGFNLGVIDMPQ